MAISGDPGWSSLLFGECGLGTDPESISLLGVFGGFWIGFITLKKKFN